MPWWHSSQVAFLPGPGPCLIPYHRSGQTGFSLPLHRDTLRMIGAEECSYSDPNRQLLSRQHISDSGSQWWVTDQPYILLVRDLSPDQKHQDRKSKRLNSSHVAISY